MSRKLKIVIDDAIPFIKGILEPYAEVLYKTGKDICPEDVRDASAMIVRTRTRVNEALLKGSAVKIVATATIGTDHIDSQWCDSQGIMLCNAAGCNADAVVSYVFTALYSIAVRKSISLEGKTIGIIGAGHVGRKVERMAGCLGFRTLKNDPPRQAAEGSLDFCDLATLLEESDVVTLHVPLDVTTAGMADRMFFSRMRKGAIFINTSRGGVVDEGALLAAIPKLGAVIIDTWCNEPYINRELMDKVDIATPHIAGYSCQGKQNATAAAVRAVARCFGFSGLYDFFPPAASPGYEAVRLKLHGLDQGEIASRLQDIYPIFTDDIMFRTEPGAFERLRGEYNYRRDILAE